MSSSAPKISLNNDHGRIFCKRRVLFCMIVALIVALTQIIAFFCSEIITMADLASLSGKINLVLNFLAIFVLAFIVVYALYLFFDLYKGLSKRFTWKFEITNRYFIFLFILFIVIWGVYFVISYPGFIMQDVPKQILMFFKFPLWNTGRLVTDGVNVLFSGSFSILTTFVYGGVFKFGVLINNIGLAVGIFTALHVLLSSVVMTWSIREFWRYGVGRLGTVFLSVWFLLNAIVAMYVVDMCADFDYTLATLIFFTMTYKLLITKGALIKNTGFVIRLIITILVMSLLKGPGLWIAVITVGVLLIYFRKNVLRYLIVITICIIFITVVMNGIVFNAMKGQKPGIQESLSVPFLQTALFFKEYKGEIPKEDHDAVDRVLDADSLAENYNNQKADSVKNTYKDSATGEDLRNYFKVWSKQFAQAPDIYLAAFFGHSWKYYGLNWRGIYADYSFNSPLEYYDTNYEAYYKDSGVDRKEIEKLDYSSDRQDRNGHALRRFIKTLNNLPFFGVFTSMGFAFLSVLMIALYFIYNKKQKKYLILIIIPLITMIGCSFSPTNGLYRYAFPAIIVMPFLYAILLKKSDQ